MILARWSSASLLVLLIGCDSPPQTVPEPAKQPPSSLDGVFAGLDGRWKGTFKVYVDTRGQPTEGEVRPTSLDPELWTRPPYDLQLELDVEQVYVSDSPTHQRVSIRDTYTEGGERRTVVSTGVNLVEDGALRCIVLKPDETVDHRGHVDGDAIVWQRELKEPLKVEWFHETVKADTYTIVGWGKYDGDDTERPPRTYFLGVYRRPE